MHEPSRVISIIRVIRVSKVIRVIIIRVIRVFRVIKSIRICRVIKVILVIRVIRLLHEPCANKTNYFECVVQFVDTDASSLRRERSPRAVKFYEQTQH